MHRPEFYSPFTAFTADGARYLAEHTDVRTVGIDYLSIATMEEVVDGHRELEKKVRHLCHLVLGSFMHADMHKR